MTAEDSHVNLGPLPMGVMGVAAGPAAAEHAQSNGSGTSDTLECEASLSELPRRPALQYRSRAEAKPAGLLALNGLSIGLNSTSLSPGTAISNRSTLAVATSNVFEFGADTAANRLPEGVHGVSVQSSKTGVAHAAPEQAESHPAEPEAAAQASMPVANLPNELRAIAEALQRRVRHPYAMLKGGPRVSPEAFPAGTPPPAEQVDKERGTSTRIAWRRVGDVEQPGLSVKIAAQECARSVCKPASPPGPAIEAWGCDAPDEHPLGMPPIKIPISELTASPFLPGRRAAAASPAKGERCWQPACQR